MIKITDKSQCCGCGACVQRCPKQCFTLVPDDEGFLYPQVNESWCIDCGLCEKVCPVFIQNDPKKPLSVYAAINPDEEIRKKSSSGGVFTALAESVIVDGGVVFGALFNDKWEVVHEMVECYEDLESLRGSKFVQSRIGAAYKEVESFLNAGRIVLFSGTPCQVAGLGKYLRKEYDNLLSVDFVCHGVSSPKLWKEYLSSLEGFSSIERVNMKDKTAGWIQYKITIKGELKILSERASSNKYMLAFLQNLSLRPSCYKCPVKKGKSNSDITLADYWGVEKLKPGMFDNRGTSFVCVNTLKGQACFEKLSIRKEIADYEMSVPYNVCLEQSSTEPSLRNAFWERYKEKGIAAVYDLKPDKSNIVKRALRWLARK